jgi:hypothetical protein
MSESLGSQQVKKHTITWTAHGNSKPRSAVRSPPCASGAAIVLSQK